MDLKGLQYVVAVADAGSFTEAAKNLFVAQPALSRKVAQIEREFGTEFFARSGRRVRLTEAGKVFCKRARHVIADCQRLEQDMDQLLRRVESLRVLCSTNGAVPYAARMVSPLRERHPNMEVLIQTLSSLPESNGTFAQGLELLRQGQADVVLSFPPELRGEGLDWIEHRCIEPGGLCAFVAQDHPLLDKAAVYSADLREYTLILTDDATAPALRRAASRALGEPPHVITSRSFSDFRVKILTEGCVGIMPASSRTMEDPFLRCLDIEDVDGGFDLEAVWSRDNKNAALKKLLNTL